MERKLTVVLAGNDRSLDRTLATSGRKLDGFRGKLSGLGGTAKVAFAGVAAGAFALGKSSIDAFTEAEESQNRLSDAYSKFPALAGGNIEAIRSLNSQLALKTRFDDDATASGQAVLAQFKLSESQLKTITPLLQDYAAKTGKDIPTTAQDLGKAVLGQGRALKSVGLDFKDTGTEAGNFEQLVGGLREQVGGFATKDGATTSGRLAIMRNQFGELQETIGSKLIPVLLTLATFLTGKVIPTLSKIGSWLGEHKPVLIAFAAVIATGLVVAFTAWATSAAAAAASTIAATAPIIAIGVAIAALVAGVIWAYQNWDLFRGAVDAVARFVTTKLWPALKTIAGFISDRVIPVIVDLVGRFIGFHTKVAEVAVAVVRRVMEIGAGIARFVADAKAKFDGIVSFVTGLPSRIRSAASGMWNGIRDSFKAALNGMIGMWNRFKIPSLTVGGQDPLGPFGPSIPKVTIGGWELPNIPYLAKGAIVKHRPGGILANVGEGRYDEAVVPLDGRRLSNGGGDRYEVTVDLRGAVIADGIQFEKLVRDALVRAVGRQGRLPGTNIVKAIA